MTHKDKCAFFEKTLIVSNQFTMQNKNEPLVLYSYFRSSTSYRARIALNYKNLNYSMRYVHLLNNGGEQHQGSYKKINPMSEVPTLVHGDKIIGQSLAILIYLEDAFPQSKKIFPVDAFQKAKVWQICEIINSGMHPLMNLKTTQLLLKMGFSEEQKQSWLTHWINQGLSALETLLAQTAEDFCFGSEVTAADITLIPQLFSSARFGADLNLYPTLKRIEQNALALKAFDLAHPLKQADAPPNTASKS